MQLPEREVTVHRFDELWRDGERRGFVIECSSGTYVRSLIADLGDAYCEALRRTRIGHFDVADADPARIVSLQRALSFLPEVRLDVEATRRVAHGQRVAVPGALPGSGPLRVTDDGGLVALGEITQDGVLRAVVGLRAAGADAH